LISPAQSLPNAKKQKTEEKKKVKEEKQENKKEKKKEEKKSKSEKKKKEVKKKTQSKRGKRDDDGDEDEDEEDDDADEKTTTSGTPTPTRGRRVAFSEVANAARNFVSIPFLFFYSRIFTLHIVVSLPRYLNTPCALISFLVITLMIC
jgi:hypothetical protein